MSQPAFDFGDEMPEEFADPTFTVGELAEAINDQLRRGFRDGIWVRGEISGLQNRGPHTYFSLVEDADGGKAVMNVQLFAPTKARLAPMLRKFRLELRNGLKVRIHGHLDFWAQGGRLGFKMASLDPKFTIGDIAQSRDEVIRRLVAEGLMDLNKQRPLSAIPLRIGVVTSVGTAAWHDFHDELQRSGIGFELSVIDARVQGDLAENMVTAAIARLSMRGHDGGLDAIVVIRGGGARNELAVFDSEKIARIIAACSVPVLTGLGHEVDRSVADDVAHTALKTPTACAGELIGRAQQYGADAERSFAAIVQRGQVSLTGAANDLSDTAHRLARRTHAAVERSDERLKMRVDRLQRSAPMIVVAAGQHLDRSSQRLSTASATVIAQADQHLKRATSRLVERPPQHLERAAQHLDVRAARVAAVDPAVQLARGWTITRGPDGTVVRSANDLSVDDDLTTTFVDGAVASRVTRPATPNTAGAASTAPDPDLRSSSKDSSS